jgi:hypothetical protein
MAQYPHAQLFYFPPSSPTSNNLSRVFSIDFHNGTDDKTGDPRITHSCSVYTEPKPEHEDKVDPIEVK